MLNHTGATNLRQQDIPKFDRLEFYRTWLERLLFLCYYKYLMLLLMPFLLYAYIPTAVLEALMLEPHKNS